jgi:hypothetical protein
MRQYEKAARAIGQKSTAPRPSRATIHRWLTGRITKLPIPEYCDVLEKMFEPWSVHELFEPWMEGDQLQDERSNVAPSHVESIVSSVAAGLRPDAPHSSTRDWGLRSRAQPADPGQALYIPQPKGNQIAERIGAKLIALSQVLRLDQEEARQLASLAGSVVDLDLRIELRLDKDGWVDITYRHDLFNMSPSPFSRWKRELWFKYFDGKPLRIEPTDATGGHRVTLDRTRDAGPLAKFACEFSPPIEPGDSVTFGYRCPAGGRFIDEQYWHQIIALHTRHYTITIHDARTRTLTSCIAKEEYPDGMVVLSNEGLMWTPTDDGVTITLTRDHLQQNQTVTVRWDFDSGPS